MKKSIAVFIISSYFFSWVVWLPLVLNYNSSLDLPTFPFQHFLGAFGPLFGLLMTRMYSNDVDLQKIYNPKLAIRNWVLAFSPVILFFIILPLYFVTSEVSLQGLGLTDQISSDNIFLIMFIWIFTYGLGEESGWRGFLFPSLEKDFPTLKSIALTAIIWAIWHLPMFFYHENFRSMGLGIIGWIVGIFAGSLILAWLTKKSKYSVLPAIIWHGTFNFFTASSYGDGFVAGAMSGIVIIISIVLPRLRSDDFR
ncbi:CPBP family intramembrane metalloprotease [Candidatus Dojkabacteria bacterium]|nr:CPBP family intramembrane metalloprotease [Candidatus Dojkabacteria bacterium]